MVWPRVDNRLVHGQIIEAWLPFTGARYLVVANDELADDVLQQEIMSLAIPQNVTPLFSKVDTLPDAVQKIQQLPEKPEIIVLFKTCRDAQRAFETGFSFPLINIGNLHYGPGKKQLCAHVAVSSDDETCLRFFANKDVDLDFRCVPSEPVQVKETW